MDSIKLCIIDDNESYRDYVKSLITDEYRIILCGDYNSPIPFIAQIDHTQMPDVCLLDIVMPEMSGLDCAQIIKIKSPETHIILVTTCPTNESIEMARLIGADFIQKGTIGDMLLDRIINNTKSRDDFVISIKRDTEKQYHTFIDIIQDVESVQENVHLLSATQKKVLQLRKENKSVNEIAKILNTNPSTISTHINRAMQKLQLPSLLEYINLEE
ncbi:MAG: response regulator transcription factor [Spirochaetota bacterium]|nr:response regulator transcription factor [Spirochaetota bacterium]